MSWEDTLAIPHSWIPFPASNECEYAYQCIIPSPTRESQPYSDENNLDHSRNLPIGHVDFHFQYQLPCANTVMRGQLCLSSAKSCTMT